MKILFGMEEIHQTGGYGGQVLIDGEEVKFASPHDALTYGIGMVHQEFSLLPDFTATENILLNREPLKYSVASEIFGERLNLVDREAMQQRALKAIERLGVNLDADMLISEMPVGHKQFTEIARELSKEDDTNMKIPFRLLVLDEPTAVLSEKEAESLLIAMKKLSEAGVAIIFISHRLQEIIDVCDTIMVMRDGQIIRSVPAEGCDVQAIANWMVGREVDTSHETRDFDYSTADKVMEIKNLWVNMPGETVRNVSLDVYKGEILGIGGLAGQGKIGIPNGIMGLYPAGGNVTFEGNAIEITDPRKPLEAGMSFVSEDRRGVGLLLDETLEWNITFTAMQTHNDFLKKIGFIKMRDSKAIEDATNEYIKLLEIRCTSSKQKAKELSGGNQQKVCLAKAFATKPKLLFVSEPTRGIDIGAKALVLNALRKYNAEQGTTIVMVSSELEELRSICDRIAIVSDGRIQGTLPASRPSEDFGLLMVGQTAKGDKANG
jgi:ABC-type sugar transport system, ATPase component